MKASVAGRMLFPTCLLIVSLVACKQEQQSTTKGATPSSASRRAEQPRGEDKARSLSASLRQPAGGKSLEAIPNLSSKTSTEWEGRTAEEQKSHLLSEELWTDQILNFYQQWGTADPGAALADARTGEVGSITARTAAAVEGWATVNPHAPMAWIDRQANNAEKLVYMQALIRSTKEELWLQPELYADWIAEAVDTPGSSLLLGDFAGQWLEKSDGNGLALWLESEEMADEVRTTFVERFVASQMVDQGKSEGLAKWIEARPQGEMRDGLIVNFIKQGVGIDAAACKPWAVQIQSEGRRMEMLEWIDQHATNQNE